MRRMAPRVLAGVLPRLYPQMLERRLRPPGRGTADLHLHRRVAGYGASAVATSSASTAAIGSRSEVRDGIYTGREGGLFTYREGKAQAIRELAEAEGDRPRAVLCLLGLGVRPADAARRRTPGRGQPRQHAGSRRARAGWEVLRFDRLHRRLKIVAAAVAAAATGGAGRSALRRAATPPRRRTGRRAAKKTIQCSGSAPPASCAADEPPRAHRRAARRPRAGRPLRQRGRRAARDAVGPRPPLPQGGPRRSSASSG